jgi:hypothetical protein
MNRYVASVLIPLTLLNLTYCTSFEVAQLEEVISSKEEKFLEVMTVDSVVYQFPPRAYIVENDTLYGKRGLMIVQDSTPVSYRGNIAINEIEYYKLKEESGMPIGIVGLIAVIAGILIIGTLIAKNIE